MTLTRERVLAMPPGEELDAAVATEVMGWRLGKGEHLGFWTKRLPSYGTLLRPVIEWSPSTSLAHLGPVLDWIVANSRIGIVAQVVNYDGELPSAMVCFDRGNATGDTLCHAVCGAALLLAISQKEGGE